MKIAGPPAALTLHRGRRAASEPGRRLPWTGLLPTWLAGAALGERGLGLEPKRSGEQRGDDAALARSPGCMAEGGCLAA